MNSVVIIEDDVDTLVFLKNIIDAHSNLKVVGTGSSLAEGRKLLAKHQPKVLLTDLGLPDGNGSELIREASGEYPDLLIMVLSNFGDEQNVIAAILAGAKGYLLKKADKQEICESVLQVIDGASPISPSIARFLLTNLKRNSPSASPGVEENTHKLLTKREVQVLELVAQGYRSNEIADKLVISYHTVVNHIRAVYEKLAVKSRSEAVFKASKLGIINT